MSAKTSAATTTATITTTTPQAIPSVSPSPSPKPASASAAQSDQNGYNSYDDYDSAIDDYYAAQDGAQPSNPESYIATAIDPSTPDIPPPRRTRTRPKNSSYDSDQLTFTDSYVGIASSTPPEPESDNDSNSIHMIEDLSDSIDDSDPDSSATAAAMMAQEMSAVQALKRLSIGASLALDPDLPNYSSGIYRSGSMSSISNNSYRTSKDSSGFDFSSSRPTRSISAPSVPSFSQARREMSQNSQRPEINSKQASQLLWVPAHVHPEIAPQQWKSFVHNKLAEIQSSQESKSESSTSRSRSSSVSSVSSNRRYSRLSRQFDNQDSYTDGADVLEKRRSTDIGVQQAHDPTIQSLSHQLESLGELEGWSVDPAQLARSLSNSDSQSSEPHDASSPTSPVNPQVPLANDSDSPILPSPTSTLRRSKVTRYNKSSIRRGKRDIIERNQNSEFTKLARSLSNSTKEKESFTEPEDESNNTPVPDERSTQPPVVPPIITTIEEPEPKQTFIPIEVSEPPKPLDTTTVPAVDQPASQTESTIHQQTQDIQQTSPLTPDNEVQEASSQTLQPISPDPHTPISPNTAEYPTDDESPGSKLKSRKGTWGWLFNNGNGDPNAPNREAGEEARKASLESNESAPSSPVQASHPDNSDTTEEQRNRKNSSGVISEKKERLTHFFSKKKSVATLKAQKEKSDDSDKLKPVSSAEKQSSSPNSRARSPAPGRERNKNKGRYRSKSKNRNKSPDRKETEEADSFSVSGSNPATISAGLVAYSPEAAAYYGAPYQIPAHQYSDKSLYMMNHRYPPHIERAIYRLSHLKLGNPKRPLIQQVLLSNFMYAYLNLINQGFIRQQQEALYRMQREQQKQLELQQKRIQKDPHYRMQQQQWQDLQKNRQQHKDQQEMDPALLYQQQQQLQQQQLQQQQLQQQQLQQQQLQQQHHHHQQQQQQPRQQQQHQQQQQQHLQQHQHKQQHLQQHHHPQQQHQYHQEQQHMYHQQQQQQYYENQYQQYGDASSQYSESGQYGSGEVYYR